MEFNKRAIFSPFQTLLKIMDKYINSKNKRLKIKNQKKYLLLIATNIQKIIGLTWTIFRETKCGRQLNCQYISASTHKDDKEDIALKAIEILKENFSHLNTPFMGHLSPKQRLQHSKINYITLLKSRVYKRYAPLTFHYISLKMLCFRSLKW